jgi:hypothetical protein
VSKYIVAVPIEVFEGVHSRGYLSNWNPREVCAFSEDARRFGSKSECKRMVSLAGYSISEAEIVEATNGKR